MPMTPLQYCAQALMRLGAQPIASFEDASLEALVARMIYPMTRDALLASHPWSFAVSVTRLARFAPDSPSGSPSDSVSNFREYFDHAFALPPHFLRALSAGADGNAEGLDYRLDGGRLLTSADAVWLRAVLRPNEAVFPPWFDALLVARLAADFCLPLTESPTRAEMLLKAADHAFRQGRLIDSQQQPAKSLRRFPLVDGRRA